MDNLAYANLMNRGLMTLTFTHDEVRSDWRYVDTIYTRDFKEDTARNFSVITEVGSHTFMVAS